MRSFAFTPDLTCRGREPTWLLGLGVRAEPSDVLPPGALPSTGAVPAVPSTEHARWA